ncbi:MAG: AraC family transcriptional regulator [Sulfitobacter sp.]
MIDIEAFQFGLASFLLGMSGFCANSLLLRRKHRWVNWPLALFFLIQSITLLPIVLVKLDAGNRLGFFHLALEFLETPLTMMQAPLFWLYIRGLTSEDGNRNIRYISLHLFPIGLAVFVYVLFLMLPDGAAEQLEQGEVTAQSAVFVLYCLFALLILFYTQIAVYLVMSIRLLTAYKTRLKDLFASTEDRELTWLWWISGAAGIYWAFSTLQLVTALFDIRMLQLDMETSIYITAIFTVPFMWIIALWGLRQQPGLARVPNGIIQETPPRPVRTTKYERSALTSDHANRIASKIEAAMQKDLLYRDPNLSLWDLAKHIAVTSNYVSQTLNETLGESFFDYVNRKRIKDAQQQMQTTDQTVLVIAYDVGFNSRSAFYRAFKREAGQTPSAWRTVQDTRQD